MSDWIPIGEPDIPTLSLDAQKVFRLIQFTTKTHYQLIRKVAHIGDDRITEAIYEIRKMESIRMGKLTNQQRAAIYAAHKDGTPQKDLAKQYGVSVPAISQLITKLSKAEQEIMQTAAEDKPKPGIINPEFDAAVNEMIAESKAADAEQKSAIAESEPEQLEDCENGIPNTPLVPQPETALPKLPDVIWDVLDKKVGDLNLEIEEREQRIEKLKEELLKLKDKRYAIEQFLEDHT